MKKRAMRTYAKLRSLKQTETHKFDNVKAVQKSSCEYEPILFPTNIKECLLFISNVRATNKPKYMVIKGQMDRVRWKMNHNGTGKVANIQIYSTPPPKIANLSFTRNHEISKWVSFKKGRNEWGSNNRIVWY